MTILDLCINILEGTIGLLVCVIFTLSAIQLFISDLFNIRSKLITINATLAGNFVINVFY